MTEGAATTAETTVETTADTTEGTTDGTTADRATPKRCTYPPEKEAYGKPPLATSRRRPEVEINETATGMTDTTAMTTDTTTR